MKPCESTGTLRPDSQKKCYVGFFSHRLHLISPTLISPTLISPTLISPTWCISLTLHNQIF